jgi:hypothetical protein
MDQALGLGVGEIIEPIRRCEPFEVSRVFDGPVVCLEAVQATCHDLLSILVQRLGQQESGVCALTFLFHRIDAAPIPLSLRLSHPSRDVKHLWSLLRPRLERVPVGYGIEEIHLRAERTERIEHGQVELWPNIRSTTQAPHEVSCTQLLDHLIERLGLENVLVADPVETYVPEQTYALHSWNQEDRTNKKDKRRNEEQRTYPAARPSRLFAQPEPIHVMTVTPDGPLIWLNWRGRERRVYRSIGPERIALPWWESTAPSAASTSGSRDYYMIVDMDAITWCPDGRTEHGSCMANGRSDRRVRSCPTLIVPHLHPYRRPATAQSDRSDGFAAKRSHDCPRYAELAVTSNFTFLRGASHPDELVHQAAQLGYEAIAVADWNSLAGIVRAHVAAKEVNLPLIVGSRLIFTDDDWLTLLVYPTSREAYARLCRLLTLGKRRASKGECHLTVADLWEHQHGLLAVALLSPTAPTDVSETLSVLRHTFDDDRLSLAVARLYGPDDVAQVQRLSKLSQRWHIPLVATNDVYYHVPERRMMQDVLTCVRHGCKISEAGYRLFPNGERYLKPPDEMARLFADHPQALARTVEIAQRALAFNLDQLRYEYADETCPPGLTPMEHLRCLTWQGASERYPNSVPDKVCRQIEHEFSLIEELNYAPYFLTVHDLVKFARSREILCQGRGAAANSAVCFCLGVTSVDPDRIDVLFERFVSRERDEPPDIDIDFEHERREEVIQYIYSKYGRERAGLTAEVITYRRRSAIRDVGKSLGFSLDAVDRIAKRVDSWENNPFADSEGGDVPAQLAALGFDANNSTVRLFVTLVRQLVGFPRHLSQHVGGFIITRTPLCELVPIENAAMHNRTVIEWDKDDIEAMGMLKVDVLGLGMLTCIRKALELIERHYGRALTLATIPAEDPIVYDMIGKSDTLGVFQIESRAQMTMLPRLRPRCFYDLVIEVAIVRPGPIVGEMVHPYLRRRNGEEKVQYPDDVIRSVLARRWAFHSFKNRSWPWPSRRRTSRRVRPKSSVAQSRLGQVRATLRVSRRNLSKAWSATVTIAPSQIGVFNASRVLVSTGFPNLMPQALLCLFTPRHGSSVTTRRRLPFHC